MADNRYSAEFLLKRLMEKTTDSIYFKDLASRFIMVNKTLANAWGFSSPNKLIGKSDFDGFQEEDARHMVADEHKIIETGESIEGLEEMTTWKDGHTAWSSTSKMPLIDDDGKIVGTFGISRNITEHKLAELKVEQYAEEMRLIKEDMEEELRLAAELQKSFYPQTYPVFPSGVPQKDSAVEFMHILKPSELVGGDICSIRRLSDSKCGVLLCDVMGHGVRAALGTAMIYAMMDDLSGRYYDPALFLKELNRRLYPVLRSDDSFLYATACYAVYDVCSGALKVANAGHPLPLLLRMNGEESTWAMTEALRGPALAVLGDAEYGNVQQQLAPGDALIMYTDGLYEEFSPEGEEFGEERLLQAVQSYSGEALSVVFDHLMGEVGKFSHESHPIDDVCLVGFTCRKLLDPHV